MPPDPKPPASTPALGEGGFEPYIRAIRRHPKLVIAVMLAVLLGAGAWLLVRSPEYRATAEVLVTPAPYYDPTYLGLPVPRDTPDDPTRVLQTAAAIFESPPAAALAARELEAGWSAGQVGAAVSVEPVGDSNVLAVQATAGRPRLAARVADAFARAALETRSRTLPRKAAALVARLEAAGGADRGQLARLRAVRGGVDPAFSPLHRATPPNSSTAASPWRILVLALIGGTVLGVAAALTSDALGRRRRPEHAEPASVAPTGPVPRR